MRVNLTKIDLLRKLIAGGLVFQASTELVLQDSRKPGKFETDSGFQKNDAFLTPFFKPYFRLALSPDKVSSPE